MNWFACHKQLSQLAATAETLTPSQASARADILNTIARWEHYINLWGGPGVGKTFLAHYLHHRAHLVYFSEQSHYDGQVSQDSGVAIDNAPQTRQEARRLYDEIRWGSQDYTGPANVILITREPIDDAVRRIELTLTDADLTHMEELLRQQFGECDFEPVSPYEQQRVGLWRHIKTVAQRGE